MNCLGKKGANSWITVSPSLPTKARYSPSVVSLKLVCKLPPGFDRRFSEANTIIALPAANCTAGKDHLTKLSDLSVR